MIKVKYVEKKIVTSPEMAGESQFVLIESKSRFINLDNVMFAETITGMLYDESNKELGTSTILKIAFVEDTVVYTLLTDELINVLEKQPNGNVIEEYNLPEDWHYQWPKSLPEDIEHQLTPTIYCSSKENKLKTKDMK